MAQRKGIGSNPQSFYVTADLATTPLTLTMAPNTAPMAAIMRYVRLGAVRVAAQSSGAAMLPVAFVNADGIITWSW